MYQSANDLKVFYNSGSGALVARILNEEIQKIWPDLGGKRVLGCGYTTPYLEHLEQDSQFCCSMMLSGQGATHWPEDDKNKTCLSEDWRIPFETNFFDHVLLVHALEHSMHAPMFMKEVWRVLKSHGTALIIVTNRHGRWAKADQTPFGQGTPYSAAQVRKLLHHSSFLVEKNKGALYALPYKNRILARTEKLFETCAPHIVPPFGGVLVFEARKLLYVGVTPDSVKKKFRGREGAFLPSPAYSVD